MKKNVMYSFWFVTIFLAVGVFVLWANYFQVGFLMFENPKRVAIKTPIATVPKGVSNTQNNQNVISKNTQSAQATQPVSTRKTRTS